MQAIREIAHDVTGAATVELADGRRLTGAEIQQTYLDAVRGHAGGAIEETQQVLDILDVWQRGIDAVRTGDHSLVDTELDWAIKERVLVRYQERLACALDDPRLARLELAFHDIDPERGLFNRLQADGQVRRIIDDADIEHAATTPPQTTRAALRGQFVTAALAAGQDYTVDWVHLKLSGTASRTVLLKDPFRNVDARVDVLLEALGA
jgi:proteasome accessory factor A